jgi:Trk K+ transport system NAD-binding subunit
VSRSSAAAAVLAQEVQPGPVQPDPDAYRRKIYGYRRRVVAHLLYIRKPLRSFLPLIAFVVLLVISGGVAFSALYPDPTPGAPPGQTMAFGRALYITWSLIFMEHLLPWPEHWLLEIYYIALPPVGLVVILDGFARFGYHILRRDETGKEWLKAVSQTMENHVVLCGLGKVGFRILQKLVALGEEVVVLEKDADCENLAWARGRGIPVRVGSGREAGIFEDLNVAKAKSIIVATNDDLANLEMAIDARKIRSDIRVVLRMYDQELAEKLSDSMDLHLAFSTAELASPLFATASTDRTIVNAFYVGERLLVVARITVNPGSELAGTKVGDLSRQHQAFVLTHRRDGKPTLHPPDETAFQTGDRLTIQCEPQQLTAIHARNKEPANVV